MQRDFTYIDDIVEGVVRVLYKPATARVDYDAIQPDPATSNVPWRVFNIGNHQPAELLGGTVGGFKRTMLLPTLGKSLGEGGSNWPDGLTLSAV